MTTRTGQPEILAPAGGPAALAAAVAAGADAVYFGLKQLNARRGAENFLPEEVATAVRTLHAAKARAYLTLNIDLTQRELGLAARQLELARKSGVDAVLVRDPALLALRPLFPELEFHFSTQAGVSSSAGVRAAKELGLRRVVLAREMSLAEIRAASAVEGMETEVFVQGALCFCASGRCLMSSWVGGRSGNRGACTSPCRVEWTINGKPAGRPLSMHDLSLASKLGALAAAGVSSCKIEGRLKKPEWVAQAVGLYRQARGEWTQEQENGKTEKTSTEPADLGGYTGRKMTSGFFDGDRHGLTGTSGRAAAAGETRGDMDALPGPQPSGVKGPEVSEVPEVPSRVPPSLAVTVAADSKGGLLWRFTFGEQSKEVRTPPQPVKKADRSASQEEITARLAAAVPKTIAFAPLTVAAPAEVRLPRSAANKLADELAAFIRLAQKEPDGQVRIELPPEVRARLQPGAPHPANVCPLGGRPNRVRLAAAAAAEFARAVPEVEIIVEMAAAEILAVLVGAKPLPASSNRPELSPPPHRPAPPPHTFSSRLIVALPQISYEADIPRLEALLQLCAAHGVRVEANSWDGWWLARRNGVRLEAGPGLMVLNALAAAELHRLGCEVVTLSIEAGREQLEDVCAAAGVPLSLLVYGRPALMHTRVWFPEAVTDGAAFTDSRGGAMRMWRDGWSTLQLRPAEPFDLCGLRNEKIRVQHLVADLVAAPDPVKEWRTLGRNPAAPTFNYARTLR